MSVDSYASSPLDSLPLRRRRSRHLRRQIFSRRPTAPLPRSARLRGFFALGPSLDETSLYDVETLNSCTPEHCSQIADATNNKFGSIGPPTETFIPPARERTELLHYPRHPQLAAADRAPLHVLAQVRQELLLILWSQLHNRTPTG